MKKQQTSPPKRKKTRGRKKPELPPNQELLVFQPDIMGEEIKGYVGSDGERYTVRIKNSVIQRGNIPKEVVIGESELSQIRLLARLDFSTKQIGELLEIDSDVFAKIANNSIKVKLAIKQGRLRGKMMVRTILLKIATGSEKEGRPPNLHALTEWLNRYDIPVDEKPKVFNRHSHLASLEQLSAKETWLKYIENQKHLQGIEDRSLQIEDNKEKFNKLFE